MENARMKWEGIGYGLGSIRVLVEKMQARIDLLLSIEMSEDDQLELVYLQSTLDLY